MPRVLSGAEFNQYKYELHKEIVGGAIFIHPTDTIYGLGCDARDTNVVNRLLLLKQRPLEAKFPVIAPSKDWIRTHCIVDKTAEEWLQKLPGPYTIILKIKNTSEFYKNGHFEETIGIRMPEHWIGEFANYFDIPLITTSANKSGGPFMHSIDDIDRDIEKGCSFIIDDGTLDSRPSTIVKLTETQPLIKER